MNDLQKYIHLSKYSRWREDLNRRETWDETVGRLEDFWMEEVEDINWHEEAWRELEEVFQSVHSVEVTPSMRTMMTAGKALWRDHAAGYNCWGVAVNHVRVFDEIFYLLMCGGGVGFSVERQYISKLPELPERLEETDTCITVRDSKIGWAEGLKQLISLLYSGVIPTWDLSKVRGAGERLKTFGGRASGPEPLDKLFQYTVRLFQKKVAQGKVKLNSLDCHDLICKIADTVIVGSVRRSACISLSNLTDDRLRRAKMGQWYDHTPERALANNSVAYTEKPDLTSYLKEMRSIYSSKAGERGIINKEALRAKADGCSRDHSGGYVLNPCGEAILRDTGGCCNLTEVIIREDDTLESLSRKVRSATILGTLQSTLTDFRYLRKVWKDNAEEERLLGVSLTGIMDHEVMSGRCKADVYNGVKQLGPDGELVRWLTKLKEVARETNREWAEILGIPASKQLTLVKPSGTVSLLADTSSGIHPRYASHYLRRVTQDNKDPLTALMIDEGVPHVLRGEKVIFTFPVKAPEGSVTGDTLTPLDQLELWKIYREYWCEGNPSQTIYYTDDTFLDVQQWVWKNWDIIGGLSFFPKDDFVYDAEAQPLLQVSEEVYQESVDTFPEKINWDRLVEFERVDSTESSQTLACAGGTCDIT